MALVDQGLSARRLTERLAKTENPRHRAMLETVIEHLNAEADISLERLLATLAPSPAYHLWHNGADNGPKGLDAITAFYSQLVAEKRGVLEFDVDRTVVDDDTVVTEGYIRAIQRGDIATAKGYLVDDEAASYLVTSRVVIFWPFNEAGQMIGEDGYANFDPTSARKLDESELPEVYKQLFAGA